MLPLTAGKGSKRYIKMYREIKSFRFLGSFHMRLITQTLRLACLEGLEPPTYWFVASHSIQLSYRHVCLTNLYYYTTKYLTCQAFFQIFLKKFQFF